VIDTHVHHFDLERFRYPWLEDPEFADLRHDYSPEQYRADVGDHGLEGWVHVQAEVDHAADPVQETAWVTTLAQQASAASETAPVACVVYADLRDPEVERLLERHCAYRLTRGVRQEAWSDPASTRADIPREDLLGDPDWVRGYRRLEDFGLSFDLLVFPRQLQQAASVVADVPGVPVVLDHLGVPDPDADPGLEMWRAGVATLAQLPHAHVKLSALSMLGNPRRADSVRSVIAELLELFGAQRCMFGSNFPVEALAGNFASMFELFLEALGDLSAGDRDEVLSGTARRFYRPSRVTLGR
jgi:predicted TIM-barrel fold metal-dependent hydrolase